MAKFFVGQRVRIVGSLNPTLVMHVGKTGRIVSKSLGSEGHWRVDDLKASNGKIAVWSEGHLEPILPEGNAPSEFSFSGLMDNLGVVMA